jgi:hypothetical protein
MTPQLRPQKNPVSPFSFLLVLGLSSLLTACPLMDLLPKEEQPHETLLKKNLKFDMTNFVLDPAALPDIESGLPELEVPSQDLPVHALLALEPKHFFLFDRIDFNQKTLLFEDEAGTTPIQQEGDRVGHVKCLVSDAYGENTIGGDRRPVWKNGSLSFDETNFNQHINLYFPDKIGPGEGNYSMALRGQNNENLSSFTGGATSSERFNFGTGSSDPSNLTLSCDSVKSMVVADADTAYGVDRRYIMLFETTNGADAKAYVDGELFTSGAETGFASTSGLSLGRFRLDSSSRWLNGKIVALLIFDRRLTASEIELVDKNLALLQSETPEWQYEVPEDVQDLLTFNPTYLWHLSYGFADNRRLIWREQNGTNPVVYDQDRMGTVRDWVADHDLLSTNASNRRPFWEASDGARKDDTQGLKAANISDFSWMHQTSEFTVAFTFKSNTPGVRKEYFGTRFSVGTTGLFTGTAAGNSGISMSIIDGAGNSDTLETTASVINDTGGENTIVWTADGTIQKVWINGQFIMEGAITAIPNSNPAQSEMHWMQRNTEIYPYAANFKWLFIKNEPLLDADAEALSKIF